MGGWTTESAMADYENLRKNLTTMERTRSKEASHDGNALTRTTTAQSKRSQGGRRRASLLTMSTQADHTATRQPTREEAEAEVEAGPDDDDDDEEDREEFELEKFMRDGHFERREDGKPQKKVGVIYKDLTVKGVGSTASFVRTLPDAILGTFGPDLWHIITRFVPALGRRSGETRTLLHGFSGCVRDGEMLLVLGRPGAGCTTFLKAISNNREPYAEVTGEVTYGGISADKQKKMYRGEVNYNPEDDIHFASLNVWQTFTFALYTKTKKKAQEDIPVIANALMRMFGISHTKYTLVGDEYTRGVSGGERKRVSIAETLASKSTVTCWDNSTRGLDASTALDYARSLRIMTDVTNRTTLVTLYQAGEGIYDVMDKVLVIDQGHEIYMGPASDAKQYFIDLGYHCPERQTTADFLTAVTDPVERQFREGYEAKAPKTPEELEKAFRASPAYQRVLEDMRDYEAYLKESGYADAERFENAVQSKSGLLLCC